jgi:hypothetical protein
MKYNIYLSGKKFEIEANSEDTLASLRQKLGDNATNYDFVYYNNFTRKKTILNDRNVESEQTVSSTTFPDNTIIMTVVQGDKTDLFGTKTDWLTNRHAGVQVFLNQSDAVAQQKNAGKFAPIMLTDVQPSNDNISGPNNSLANAFYKHVVICEQGSLIGFNISSWGAAGYGYRITTEKDTICDALYNGYGDNPNHQANIPLYRYQDSKNTIQIESTQTLNIPTDDAIYYQKVTVTTWRLTSYEQDGKTYSSDMQAPTIIGPSRTRMIAPSGGIRTFALAATSGGFDPGPTGGNTYVPGSDIQTASPSRGPESGQNFGTARILTEDDRNNTVLGAIVFYFFVFKDHEAANRVINVLNAPNPNAIG